MSENKKDALDELKEKMEKDDMLPLKKGATRLVFGAGNPNTKMLFIGEGPGYWEDQKGEPFVGNAGKLLDRLLGSIGVQREKVYITNVVHHRPPENRDPEPEEIKAYGVYLDQLIDVIRPRIFVTLGRFSMAKFLPGARISSVHGTINDVKWRGDDVIVVPMYHPAAALRNGNILNSALEDFKKLKVVLQEESKPKIEQSGLF